MHLGIVARTLEIRAIEVTDNSTGDAPMLPELLSQIPTDEAIGSVSGDGVYDTKARHAAIARRDAQAIIPPRKNAKARKARRAVRHHAMKPCGPVSDSDVESGRSGVASTGAF